MHFEIVSPVTKLSENLHRRQQSVIKLLLAQGTEYGIKAQRRSQSGNRFT